jgi:hypothetical protein
VSNALQTWGCALIEQCIIGIALILLLAAVLALLDWATKRRLDGSVPRGTKEDGG